SAAGAKRRSAERVPARAARYGNVPIDAAPLDGSKWSFDGVLRRVLGFSRAAEMQNPRRSPQTQAFDALNLFVRTLDEQTRDKLRAVIRAGREASALGDARSTLAGESGVEDTRLPDLFGEGALAFQHLQRGHAIACATRFDLEAEIARWAPTQGRASVDARTWLRFGRELALHPPVEWSCLGAVGPGNELEALYLRRGDTHWWSFDLVIDRPSARDMARRRTLHVKSKRKLVPLPLEGIGGRRFSADRPALERAAHAVSARLGFSRTPAAAAPRARTR
ncbi:MAG TPA: hypothetical protein VF103_01695, partial [Polyangiaceae bacterium]